MLTEEIAPLPTLLTERQAENSAIENKDRYELPSLEESFGLNLSKCEHIATLWVMKIQSEIVLIRLRQEESRSDLTYIDTSHIPLDDFACCRNMLAFDGGR